MALVIQLTPDQEARLADRARREGVEPDAMVKRMVAEQLHTLTPAERAKARLREWQAEDRTRTAPSPPQTGMTPTEALFAQWEREDQLMSDEEREADDQLWAAFQRGIDEERVRAGMRTLF